MDVEVPARRRWGLIDILNDRGRLGATSGRGHQIVEWVLDCTLRVARAEMDMFGVAGAGDEAARGDVDRQCLLRRIVGQLRRTLGALAGLWRRRHGQRRRCGRGDVRTRDGRVPQRLWAAHLRGRSQMDVQKRAGGQAGGGWLRAGDGGVDRPNIVGAHVGERDQDIPLCRAAALVDMHRVTASRSEADHLQLGADVLGLGVPAERHRA